MELTPVEVLQEVERQFPKELMICVQAVQIRKLTEQQDDTDDE
jgi:hypothetical protein|tara:strand:+ start:173 stop:301 length:129 start_codon:yes stop_codon:yes gene_type:complete